MTGSKNTYKFNLHNKRTRDWMLKKQDDLITKLKDLGVRVNKPHEMRIDQLEILVNQHRSTVESRKTVVSDTQLKIAEMNGMTKQDVLDRVDDLNWDVEHAVNVKSKKEERRIRKQKRVMLLQDIREYEIKKDYKKVAELGKVLASL